MQLKPKRGAPSKLASVFIKFSCVAVLRLLQQRRMPLCGIDERTPSDWCAVPMPTTTNPEPNRVNTKCCVRIIYRRSCLFPFSVVVAVHRSATNSNFCTHCYALIKQHREDMMDPHILWGQFSAPVTLIVPNLNQFHNVMNSVLINTYSLRYEFSVSKFKPISQRRGYHDRTIIHAIESW
jgi:hypothetical protein